MKNVENKSAFRVMSGLIGLVKPMLGMMTMAVIMGCIGNLMATFITVFGGIALVKTGAAITQNQSASLGSVFTVIIILALLRGVMRYAEQACNHYIAFKLLARIRHKVFAALRRLAPARLDGKEKGNLISIITSDIELLEVFYAHTISPILIAFITSLVMCIYIGFSHWSLGLTALVFYVLVGGLIPVANSRKGQKKGQEYRKQYGALSTMVLDHLYGLEEIIQYGCQHERLVKMEQKTADMEEKNHALKKDERGQRIVTDSVILAAGITVTVLSGILASRHLITPAQAVTAVIAVMSSFGPTAALSALSNNLNQTLASGNRVLNLLEETPVVEDITGQKEFIPSGAENSGIDCQNVTFTYRGQGFGGETDTREVLKEFSTSFKQNKIYGILGRSGCGKSTLLKLMMRFYEPEEGDILHCKIPVGQINTASLRDHISYVTQETFLFDDTVENNIRVADLSATREQVIEAAKKASIHDFILSLPKGYDTRLGALGNRVSGGERQRIGVARAFLQNGRVLLLDEPTSNIDSLNESIILKSIEAEKKEKTVIIVSHRKSTMAIADEVFNMTESA